MTPSFDRSRRPGRALRSAHTGTAGRRPHRAAAIRARRCRKIGSAGRANCSGTIDARFGVTTLLAAAEANTTCSIELSYTISASSKLTLLVNQVKLPKPKIGVAGPGGIQASFAWQGFQCAGSSAMLTAMLINDVAAYT
ncbi:MAG: phage tail tube protein [Dongiaceae bacterium]